MATTKRKRRRGFQGKGEKGKRALRKGVGVWVGMGVLVAGLIVWGMVQALGGEGGTANEPALSVKSESLESVSLSDAPPSETAAAAPLTDRETTYLGPPTDASALAHAEAGQAGMPTLVWFHADW